MWGLIAQIKELQVKLERPTAIYAIFEHGFNHEYFISAWSTREKAETELKRIRAHGYSFFIEVVELDKQ